MTGSPASPVHSIPSVADERPSAPGWLPVDAVSAERIAAVRDPAVRNLWITQAYADFAHRLAVVLDADQTWCTFGVWASNTAGVSIRGTEIPGFVDRLLHGAGDHVDAAVEHARRTHWLLTPFAPLERFGREHVAHLVDEALGQVSTYIAHGNTLVYRELAPLFVAFVERLEHDPPGPEADPGAVLDELGIPSSDEAELVHLAFHSWLLASTTRDERRRAQLVLAGNVAAVLHEQERLQDDIGAALDAGLLDARDELAGATKWFVPGPIRRLVVDRAVDRITPHLERLWEHVATHLMMTLAVPGALLHLGTDVPAPPGGPLFPDALDPLDLSETVALMSEWDPTGGTGRGSGASDWSVLHQRMGYIVNLFRSRQRRASLGSPPFTQAQVDRMMLEQLPDDL